MFLILGATAVGKSELAAEAAAEMGWEVVGADAFQIYEGLDVLTGKPPRAVLERVRHHLMGEVPLGRKFDAAQYRELALERIGEIEGRGKEAVVTGGTGLYVRALTEGLGDAPAGDAQVRGELEALTLEELQRRYAELDPRGMERIDRRNARRLVRAIEVCLTAGRPYSALRADWSGAAGRERPELCGVVLTREWEELHVRIDERVRRMFAEGVVGEVRAAAEAGPTAREAIGYREIRALLRGELTTEECIVAMQRRTRQYAKRQLTWLRGGPMIVAIDLTRTPPREAVRKIVEQMTQAGHRRGGGV